MAVRIDLAKVDFWAGDWIDGSEGKVVGRYIERPSKVMQTT